MNIPRKLRHAALVVALCLPLPACQSRAPQPAAYATTTPGSPAGHWQVSDDLQITELSPNVWMHTSWHVLPGNRRVSSNGLIVREDDGLVLVDTAWGVAPTEALVDWVDSELKLPIRRVLATHYHDDRLGGWPVMARREIPLVATPLTMELADSENITQTLDASLNELTREGVAHSGTLEVFYPGPGHSPDNVLVWLPEARILFGGCAVKAIDASTLGNTDNADLSAWPQAIGRAQQRYTQARTVVPGHGDPGGPELLAHTLDLLQQAN